MSRGEVFLQGGYFNKHKLSPEWDAFENLEATEGAQNVNPASATARKSDNVPATDVDAFVDNDRTNQLGKNNNFIFNFIKNL